MRHSISVFVTYCFIISYPCLKTWAKECPYRIRGHIPDTLGQVEDVIEFNNEALPLLKGILITNYFKFFKVNLNRGCLFWKDGGECSSNDCHVKDCKMDDIPEGLKNCKDAHLGNLDRTITNADQASIDDWTKHDEFKDNAFCELNDESDSNALYFDLLINPERYTGYKGSSAHKVWYSVYEENCFKETPIYGKQTLKHQGDCLEKRSFYRMVSGLHTSINTHLSHLYLLQPKNAFNDEAKFGPNLEEFRSRFHPSNCPESFFRLMNLYFTYVVELKALVKVAPYLKKQLYYTGDKKEDEAVRTTVIKLLELIESKGNFFDETALFQGTPEIAGALKRQFRNHFRNISRIMDCVGCEKCRLWGKLQTQGMGTALRILFTGHEFNSRDGVTAALPSNFEMKRTEIVSLFNAFGRLGTSISAVDQFCQMEHEISSSDSSFHTSYEDL